MHKPAISTDMGRWFTTAGAGILMEQTNKGWVLIFLVGMLWF
jgi:hypothetical protein